MKKISIAPILLSAFIALPLAACGKKVTVTWKNEDGTVLETDVIKKKGTIPTYDGAEPTKTSTAEYEFKFAGWSPEVVVASEDATYTATFSSSVRKYTVTWKNWDGNVLETDENVPYGSVPTYDGAEPTREQDAQYTYAWDNWDKEVSAVTGDVVYTANFNNTTRKYTVTWKNWNGDVLEIDENVPYGTVPTFDGADPEKAKTPEVTYTWNLWDHDIAPVTGETTYIAHFDESKTKYKVEFYNGEDKIIEYPNIDFDALPESVYDEEAPVKENTHLIYSFDGWEEDPRDEVNYIRTFHAKFVPVVSKNDKFNFTLINDDAEYQIRLNGSYTESLMILPSEYEGKPVTSIASEGFRNLTTFQELVIPSSYTDIGASAFANCSLLRKLTIKGSPNIGNYAFQYTSKMEEVHIEGGSSYTIGEYAFYYCGNSATSGTDFEIGEGATSFPQRSFQCSGIKALQVPNSVTTFGYESFDSATKLTSVTFGDDPHVTSLSTYTFYATGLKSIVLPDSITSFGSYIFCRSQLESITFPDSVFTIGSSLFDGCDHLTHVKLGKQMTVSMVRNNMFSASPIEEFEIDDSSETLMVDEFGVVYSTDGKTLVRYPAGRKGSYTIPSIVNTICEYAFFYSKYLSTISIPEGVTTIKDFCFEGASISTIELPSTLTTICDYAFKGSGLTSFEIPANVSSLGIGVFDETEFLTTLTVASENDDFSAFESILFNKDKTALICCLSTKTSVSTYNVPASVETIADYAFSRSNLTDVAIGNNVTSIGTYAFYYAEIETLSLGTGVDTIPAHCFDGSKLATFVLPSTIVVIGEYAFSYSKLSALNLPDATVTISSSAFSYCRELATVNLNKVKYIGNSAFYECDKLEEVVVPNTVTTLQGRAFSYCDKLATATLNNQGVVGYACFENDSSLKTVVIGNDVTEIQYDAFEYCSEFDDLTLGSGLKFVGSYAFYYTKLSSVTLPASVTHLDNYCFFNAVAEFTKVIYLGTKAEFLAIIPNHDVGGKNCYVSSSFVSQNVTTIQCSDLDIAWPITE